MKVSVIIPAYNEDRFIGPCLESIARQSVSPDEVIVVDNNSTDYTASIAKRFGIKVVKEKKQGMVYARNKGYNLATGDLLIKCDADCRAPNNWVKQIKTYFGKNKTDALSGPTYYYDLPNNSIYISYLVHDIMYLLLNRRNVMFGPNMVITSQIWSKVKNRVCLEDSRVHEDFDLSIHIYQEGGKVDWDKKFNMATSGRRMKHNPLSAFLEYPYRTIKMLKNHYVTDYVAPTKIPITLKSKIGEYRKLLKELVQQL